ncbi:carbohydrate kinase [Bermanella marisrubri]|uniref:Sugar (Pentulose and hexulose) kinase n=1 Tax=Bermanella marisrubri TaxID=207949 RepID=Q1N4T7_9GAMM|nr:FGGY-family carbohydrate kinase [Bermanella marisrubri]EAT13341.1 Sugar (pentulose and hexulose) kinase [Oceanobacter sp. RED65] [Bermanella marisrubri]QIZ84099.1 carbohydrate kinase [Bermanella marisrubri]
MHKQTILTIDNGTQSVRALLFSLNGDLLAKGKVEIEPYFSKHPGWAEQDPDYYWKSAGEACKALWSSTDYSADTVVGLGVTTQRGTVVNVDEYGKPLRPAIIWLDQRHAEIEKPIKGIWGVLFKVLGLRNVVEGFQRKAQAAWIEQNQPDVWRNTHKFLLLSGYLNYRLTGQYKDSVGSTVGYLPFDYKKHAWAGRHDWKWQVANVRKEMLPELVKPGEVVGELEPHAAEHLGLKAGVPVVACASDKACEVIGSGGNDSHIACLSYGTTATINTTTKRYIEPVKFIPPYPAAIPESYNTEVMIYRGFWMVSWFKNQFGLRERQIAEERGVPPEMLFDELVDSVPAGSMGLMLQPYWSPGTRIPGPEAKGSVIGFGDVHTRAHLYRSILEGLAYGLREGKERIEKRSGTRITKLRVSGGGSQSDAAMQLTADIFNLPAERPSTYETSGLGAAINVAVGLGFYENYDVAIDKMTSVGDIFYPDLNTSRLYNELYKSVYLKMYKRLQPLYKQIKRITGYPQ